MKQRQDWDWGSYSNIANYHGEPFMCDKNWYDYMYKFSDYLIRLFLYLTRVNVYPNGKGTMECCDHLIREIKLFQGWHRLYMVNFERGLHGSGLDRSVGLPYWDWTFGDQSAQLQIPRLASMSNWLTGTIKGQHSESFRRYKFFFFVF